MIKIEEHEVGVVSSCTKTVKFIGLRWYTFKKCKSGDLIVIQKQIRIFGIKILDSVKTKQ